MNATWIHIIYYTILYYVRTTVQLYECYKRNCCLQNPYFTNILSIFFYRHCYI